MSRIYPRSWSDSFYQRKVDRKAVLRRIRARQDYEQMIEGFRQATLRAAIGNAVMSAYISQPPQSWSQKLKAAFAAAIRKGIS